MADQPPLTEFKDEALKNPHVKAAYDEVAPAYAMKRDLIAMRKAKGFTLRDMGAKKKKARHF